MVLEKDGKDQFDIACDKVLNRVNENRNILQTIKPRKSNRIGHILRRNCSLNHVIKGNVKGRIEVAGRRGGKCKQLLNDLKETGGHWNFNLQAPCVLYIEQAFR